MVKRDKTTDKARELPRTGEYRYVAHVYRDGRHFRLFVVQLHQPHGETQSARYGHRFDIADQFGSESEAMAHAAVFANEIGTGQHSSGRHVVKDKINGYRIEGSARYVYATDNWQPSLRIVSRKEGNRGAVQEVDGDEHAPFHRNLSDSEAHAADFAFEYGKRMVLNIVGGLRI